MSTYVKLGELEKAKKVLDKSNEVTKGAIFKIGEVMVSSMKSFRGFLSILFSREGALFSLSRDFKTSKVYFDKASNIVNKIDPETQDFWDQKATGLYYISYGAYYLGLQGKYKEAAEVVDKGLSYMNIYYLDLILDNLNIETAYIYSSELHLIIRNYNKALGQINKAINVNKSSHNKVAGAREYTILGQIYYQSGERQKAKQAYETALEFIRKMKSESTENWKLFYGLGQVYEDLHERDKALQYYRNAVKEVEKLWGGRFKDTQKQVSFIDDRLVVFEPVIRILHSQGKDEEAIYYMELSKSRTFYETSPYYSEEKTIDTKDRNIIKPLIVDNIRELVPDNTAILEYYMGEHSVIGAVITRKGVYIKELQETTPEDLQQDVIALKIAIESRTYPYQERALKLYSILIEPFSNYLSGYESICIIPHGVLHYLPFQALVIDEIKPSFVIDKYKIFYAPSLTILDSAYKSSRNNKTKLLAIANSLEVDIKDLNVGKDVLGKLAYVKDEAKEVGSLFNDGNKTVLIDDKATETFVKNSVNNFDMILFSTHGILLGEEPLKSCIFLAKDNKNDGRLTVAEIEGMNMNINLVILSACETGLVANYEGVGSDKNPYNSKFPHGDDLVGLQRAFMKAGASSVLSTLWTVNDEATKSLIVDFVTHYKSGGTDKISALQAAELEIKSKKGWEHPYFWASFVLSGDWR